MIGLLICLLLAIVVAAAVMGVVRAVLMRRTVKVLHATIRTDAPTAPKEQR
jgi:hypothetical protein